MTDYLLADPIARLHLLILPLKINGMENFGLLNIKETVSFKPKKDAKDTKNSNFCQKSHFLGSKIVVFDGF